MQFDSIIYHSGCPDGISSLWCALRYNKISEIIACKPGVDPVFEHKNRDILFVDISPSENYLLKIQSEVKSISILDHHKTTREIYTNIKDKLKDNVKFIIDMNRAGCQITWDYFFPNIKRPWFIDYVADRDMWTWKLPNSK
jgi:oligoribonuclease NrnB/cAMP/cGMP phosphodiesterase (DHH superfamily)